ncbi:MAG: class I SAM-dependent methyltransferase [Chloroflexi bacterium]|nr:class I SAM-dependent methyltransferase [Chloroflexota bacterium]
MPRRSTVERAPTCPLCGGRRYGRLWRTADYALWRCVTCRLTRRQLLRSQPNLYAEADYFAGYLRDREQFRAIFTDLLDTLERERQPPGRLLDVGCGIGLLLECARERGWMASGVEVSEWAATEARRAGFDVRTGDVASVEIESASVDAIVINHVLEHVDDPLATLELLASWLAPGGVLAVGAPNFGSPMAIIEREHWPALIPLQHVWQLTPATLDGLLRRAGLIPLRRTTAMQPRNYRRHPKDWVKRALYAIATRLNAAETMVVLARRPSPS